MLEIAVAARSETGQRDHNEDKVAVAHEGPWWVAVLADGAGGHRGGAAASRRAVQELMDALHDAGPRFGGPTLNHAVLAAHARLRWGQAESQGTDRMHTTVVALWVDSAGEQAVWSHVGDSRLYRVCRGRLELMTTDDSVVQSMVDAGVLTPEQALSHPQRNQLIAALGIDDDVDPHTVAQPVALAEGEAYLLCSDGWWGSLEEHWIADTLAEASGPEEWLAAMQRHIEARATPHQDNFSAIGVWVGDFSEATRPMPYQAGGSMP